MRFWFLYGYHRTQTCCVLLRCVPHQSQCHQALYAISLAFKCRPLSVVHNNLNISSKCAVTVITMTVQLYCSNTWEKTRYSALYRSF